MTDPLLAQLSSEDPMDWEEAAHALGERGAPGDAAALKAAIGRSRYLDQAIASAFGELGDPSLAPVLLDLARTRVGGDLVPLAAFESLAALAHPGCAPALRALAEDPDFEDHLEEMLPALLATDDGALDPWLADQLSAEDPLLRVMAADGVGLRGLVQADTKLRGLLDDEQTRVAARRALVRLGVADTPALVEDVSRTCAHHGDFISTLRATPASLAPVVGPVLVRLSEELPERRLYLLQEGLRLNHPPAREAVHALLADSRPTPVTKAHLRIDLLSSGDASQVLPLLAHLEANPTDERDVYVRRFMVQRAMVGALATHLQNDPTHLRVVLELLDDIRRKRRTNPAPVRESAQQAIERLTGTTFFTEFDDWMRAQDWSTTAQPTDPPEAAQPTSDAPSKPWWKLW